MASRKSSPDNTSQSPPAPQQDLVFVNVSNPAGIDSQSVRRLVRSSATRHSHRDPTRKPKSRKSDRGRTASSSSSRKRSPLSSFASRGSSPDEELSPPLPSPAPPTQQAGWLFTEQDRAKVARLIDQNARESGNADALKVGQTGQYSAQPNNSYPVEAEEWFPWVLSFYRTVYLPQGISILQQSDDEGSTFIDWFMREGNSESALFYMQLLTACTQLANRERVPNSHVDWLRNMVVRSINEAISDSERSMSTATLLAVAFIGLHEHLYGDKPLAIDVHAPAFVRMLEMRGGVEHAQLPPLAWKILLWVDTLVSGRSIDGASASLTRAWVSERRAPSKPD